MNLSCRGDAMKRNTKTDRQLKNARRAGTFVPRVEALENRLAPGDAFIGTVAGVAWLAASLSDFTDPLGRPAEAQAAHSEYGIVQDHDTSLFSLVHTGREAQASSPAVTSAL